MAVVNIPFNEKEPIVCKPEETMEDSLCTKMGALVIGNGRIRK